MPHPSPEARKVPFKRRIRAIPVFSLTNLNLDEANRDKQADNLKTDAYQFGRLIGNKIRIKLRDGEEKGLRDLVWSWGVSVDKVLGGVEASGLSLHVPGILIDKLLIAVNMKRKSTQVVDNIENKS